MNRNDVNWKGYIPAITTPFDHSGRLDEAGWRKLLQLLIKQGMHGVVFAGTSGEWYSMTPSERRYMLEVAVDEIGSRTTVIAGISAFRPDDVIKLAHHAKEVGADGVMFTPPPYAVPSPDEVLAFYQSVSDQTDIPIIVYNWQRGTGVEIDVSLALRLADVENVVAIKYATPNRGMLYEMTDAVKDKILVFGSYVNRIGIACLLEVGGDGNIAGGALLGEDGPSFFEAVWNHDLERARTIARKNEILTKGLFYSNYAGRFGAPQATIKAAMNLMGQPGGYPRPPYLPLEEPEIEKVREVLVRAGILPSDQE
jgi:4-hydroxy-tetrahydrodipicolinate synthase